MPTSIAQAVPTEEEIASDFTLNTFKLKLLSVQYTKVSFVPVADTNLQVPFCLGIRGPESLRRGLDVSSTAVPLGTEPVIPESSKRNV